MDTPKLWTSQHLDIATKWKKKEGSSFACFLLSHHKCIYPYISFTGT